MVTTPGSQTLYFAPDHPCNTRITDSKSGDLLYVVRTKVENPGKRTLTEVRKAATGEVLATFEWRDFKANIVTLGNAPPVKAGDWMKKSLMPFNDSVTFKDDPWKALKWKNFSPALSLELFHETDKSVPLARFKKPDLSLVDPSPASLEVSMRIPPSSSYPDLRDRIVISFLYLEKLRRERDEDDFNATSSSRGPSRQTQSFATSSSRGRY